MTEQERIAHLGFIQDAISRMAREANSLKAWLVPVATASYGAAILQREWAIAVLGIAASLAMGLQATKYLQIERAYVNLYNKAINEKDSVFAFAMTPDIKSIPLWRAGGANGSSRKPVLRSWSCGGFFGVFILAGIFALCVALFGWGVDNGSSITPTPAISQQSTA